MSEAQHWEPDDVMRRLRQLFALVALPYVAVAPQPAWSRPISGQSGAQSGATIGIRVSVNPSFRIESSTSAGTLQSTSNASALRYNLLAERSVGRGNLSSTQGQPAGDALKLKDERDVRDTGLRDALLVLIVPD